MLRHDVWVRGLAAAAILGGCGSNNGLTGLTTTIATIPFDEEGGDDDDDATSGSPTGGSETSATTADPPTSGATAETSTSGPTADTSSETTQTATTEVCPPGTVGCPCDAGACGGDLVCTDDVCVSPSCGDGKVDPGEGCDDGGDNGPGQACLDDCVVNVCGDGDKGPGEGCDAGVSNKDTGTCTSACKPATCGDGLVWMGHEECDDGAQNGDTEACLSSCADNVCGDGFVLAGQEQCDDGNLAANDGCSPSCKTESMMETLEVVLLDLPIPDNGYNGSQASMVCVDLMALKSGVVTNVTVKVAIDHAWLGELTIKLYSPDQKVLTLMNRPGLAEIADDGLWPGGDSSDLQQVVPIEFRDGAGTSAETMGAGLASNEVVCEADGICTFAPNKGAAAGLANFAGFDGIQAKGQWRLCVGDSVVQFAGVLGAVTLYINGP